MPLNIRSQALRPTLSRLTTALGLVFAAGVSLPGWAQNFPITEGQRATANQVAQAGVPLSELAPDAPDSHTVRRGDTLWRIAGIFLKSPWRWPELWGMNLDEIRNPHRIYPGQVLYLDKTGGRARLSTRKPGDTGPVTVRVSPRIRSESLSESAIPPIAMQEIEAFLAEPLIVDEATFARAPRIVATPENRVLLSLGDRAYARGNYGDGAATGENTLSTEAGKPRNFRVFRNAVALKDPSTGEVLGYEAQYVGKARLVRGESREALPVSAANQPPAEDTYRPAFNNPANIERVKMAGPTGPATPPGEIVPASLDITAAKEEMRVGDRLLPEPPRDFALWIPRAPVGEHKGQIVSVYGNAVRFAAQNQVVAINRGTAHGLENGHVLMLLRDTNRVIDKTDESRPSMRLPGEQNGLMLVFRTFEKLSYALVLEIGDGVKVGDHFVNP